MRIAILSGKGGTGKTLVSVNLATVASDAVYIDCDVEEPNGHIFLKPIISKEEDIMVRIPECDATKCTSCRTCVDFCNFNALAYINKKLMIFENICHSCGGCMLVCPEKAITEKPKSIGIIKTGNSNGLTVLSGIMNTGEESGVQIIKKLLDNSFLDKENIIIDCPPGSSCAVIESIKDADYCLLVTEPTILGIHDLTMVVELVKLFEKPHAVIINKCTSAYNPVKPFCLEKRLKILCEIPFSNELGNLNSNGLIATRESVEYKKMFCELLQNIEREIQL